MSARLFSLLLTASLCLWSPSLAEAKPASEAGAAYFQQVVEQAFQLTHPGASYVTVRRQDLEKEFSAFAGTARAVFFYQFLSGTPAAGSNESIWAVVPEAFENETYRIYDFEISEGLDQITQEFNRLMGPLAVPNAGAQRADLARFFLSCCVHGDDGEVVTDDESLRHAVERYYLAVFGDTPRMLQAFAKWWTAYQRSGVDAQPHRAGDGIAIKRIVLAFGTHPQLQQWDLLVSREGSVRIESFEPVFFPQGDHWVFYDFRSGIRLDSARAVLPALPQLPSAR